MSGGGRRIGKFVSFFVFVLAAFKAADSQKTHPNHHQRLNLPHFNLQQLPQQHHGKWRPFNSRFNHHQDNFYPSSPQSSYDLADYDDTEPIPELGDVKFFVADLKDRIGDHLSNLLSEEDPREKAEMDDGEEGGDKRRRKPQRHYNKPMSTRGLREFLLPENSKLRKFMPLPLLGMKRGRNY